MGVKIRERPKGSGVYWLFVDHKGRRKAKKVGSPEAAEAKKAELEKALTDKSYRLPTKKQQTTLRQFASAWMEQHVKQNLKPATVRDYKDTLERFLYPVFGSTPLDLIKRTELKGHCSALLRKGLSKTTVHHVVRVLSAVLNSAIEDEYLPLGSNVASNPGRFVKLPRPGEKADALSQGEATHLLGITERHDAEFYPILAALLRAGGPRKGEVRSLQWTDISWEDRTVTISRAFSRNEISTPKSGKPRTVPMGDRLYKALQAHKHRMEVAAEDRRIYLATPPSKRKGMKRGLPMTEWVFSNPKGKPWGDSYINGKLDAMLKLAGLRHIRVHDLRHTVASQQIKKGNSPATVSRDLGHGSYKIRMDIYGKHLPVDHGHANLLDEPEESATPPQPEAITTEAETPKLLN